MVLDTTGAKHHDCGMSKTTYPERVLGTSPQVAEMLGVSPETVRRWAKQNKIPSIRLPGGTFKFDMTEIAKLLDGLGPLDTTS